MGVKHGGTISTYEFFQQLPDEQSAIDFLEEERWPDGVTCPRCGCERTKKIAKSNRHQCNGCRKQFTVRTGTVFEHSHIPLHKWLYAMYLLQTARKGISSMQLSKELGVTQRTAWFLLHRLREAMDIEAIHLTGEVEIDKTYLGGLEKNKHSNKKARLGGGVAGKQPVLGMRQREGPVTAKPVPNTKQDTVRQEIFDTVDRDATIYTDESSIYRNLGDHYDHEIVRHNAREYVNERASTNSIESV